jgi:nicotinamidase-related amidase
VNHYLIVVDMQNDFIDGALGTAEAVFIVPEVCGKIKSHLAFGRGPVVFTRDTHGEDYLDTAEGRQLPIRHCVQGSVGWMLHPDIAVLSQGESSRIFDKPTFGSTEMALYLAARHAEQPIDSIEVVGLCTDICVIANAMLLKTFLPEAPIRVDSACCAGVTPERHENALAAMRACQIEIRKPIKIEGIVDAREEAFGEFEQHLNLDTGEIAAVSRDHLGVAEDLESENDLDGRPAWEQDAIRDALNVVLPFDHYERLPNQYELDTYSMMEEFADTFPIDAISEALSRALDGRGAFRRFKDCVLEYGIEEQWYAWRSKALLNVAESWCAENGIAVDRSGRASAAEGSKQEEKQTNTGFYVTVIAVGNKDAVNIVHGVYVYATLEKAVDDLRNVVNHTSTFWKNKIDFYDFESDAVDDVFRYKMENETWEVSVTKVQRSI